LLGVALSPFSDPETVALYTEGPVRQVAGFYGLQGMTGLLGVWAPCSITCSWNGLAALTFNNRPVSQHFDEG
jgi:hypothetical protein